jgi:hypothetical protein
MVATRVLRGVCGAKNLTASTTKDTKEHEGKAWSLSFPEITGNGVMPRAT